MKRVECTHFNRILKQQWSSYSTELAAQTIRIILFFSRSFKKLDSFIFTSEFLFSELISIETKWKCVLFLLNIQTAIITIAKIVDESEWIPFYLSSYPGIRGWFSGMFGIGWWMISKRSSKSYKNLQTTPFYFCFKSLYLF